MTVLSGLGHKARASIQIVWAVFISSSYLALQEEEEEEEEEEQQQQQQRKGRVAKQ